MMSLPPVKPHELDRKFEFLSVLISIDDPHVSIVALNRPRKRNAINSKMWKEIGQAFSILGRLGDGCRCVLLVGSGKAFCGGIDVSDPLFMSSNGEIEDVGRRGVAFLPQVLEMQRCFTAIETCPVPVIAAIHGSCIGAGIDMTCCADIRVCSRETVFSVREVKLGLAADVGTLQRLPKIVGQSSRVRELCLTGDDFGAFEAKVLGFVSRVASNPDELMQEALGLCRKIVHNSPLAVFGTKMSLNYSRDHTVEEGLEHIATHNALALQSDDTIKSFSAVFRGEKPSFDDLPIHSRL